ncbi:MAG: hypothetical protein WHU54_02010 [Candidatus Bathyarchaeia archaeon]|jgi:hypothetical protein
MTTQQKHKKDGVTERKGLCHALFVFNSEAGFIEQDAILWWSEVDADLAF